MSASLRYLGQTHRDARSSRNLNTMTSAFHRVASLSELPASSLLAVETPSGERICLVNRGGEVSALSDVCPHQAFPISAGQLLDDGTVQCVWHGARFDCRSGAVRQGPATDDLPVYDVRVVDGEILVREEPRDGRGPTESAGRRGTGSE